MTIITKNNGKRQLPFDEARLVAFIESAACRYPKLKIDAYTDKVIRAITSKDEYKAEQITKLLTLTALENVDMSRPDWTYVAAYIHLRQLYKQASKNRVFDASKKYGDFYGLLTTLTNKGVYSPFILEQYSKEEIADLAQIIDPERDKLFTYIGLKQLSDRYLATDHEHNVYELPQERWLIIAMHLMALEPKAKRSEFVKEAYWALSNLYMTVATPTLANAGKAYGQLSSCFIDTVEDDLRSIYDSNTDIALLSKDGGGIGTYLGKVRALGSSIKGFKGKSSGVIPWIRQLNNTAVSVDQLGQRPGAIAIYLDVFHKDLMDGFLDLKTNNGDERKKAHDIFTGVTIPDLFMQKLEEKDINGKSVGQWSVFCPHEVKQVMGWKDEKGNALGLEDFYDETDRKYFTEKYEEAVKHPLLSRKTYRAMDIMVRIMVAQLETGTPFMFYRDEVNRKNPNKHTLGEGRTSIFCSNLCTEIAQNQSPTVVVEELIVEENGETYTITKRKHGDFVVCNLSSINLAKAVTDDVLERLIPIEVRMLDNVIDLNTIEVKQAASTNKKYRAVGLGTFGWHHLLALKGIHWESEESVEYADKLYEDIAYLTIKASADLAKEKGAYPMFADSEWATGEYFSRRGYIGIERWNALALEVFKYGIRNGYLMSPAPNGATSIIAGSSAATDPIYDIEYSEEKKDYKIMVTAPDINAHTFQYYKPAHAIDQLWSIRQNAARQRHIDQSISFNIYVKRDVNATELLQLHLNAWKLGLKTTYYIRSTTIDFEECDFCAS
jgi:ribonucleoside-diphosphate reductase alpha chain